MSKVKLPTAIFTRILFPYLLPSRKEVIPWGPLECSSTANMLCEDLHSLPKCLDALWGSRTLSSSSTRPNLEDGIHFLFENQTQKKFMQQQFDLCWKWKMEQEIEEIYSEDQLESELHQACKNGLVSTCLFLLREAKTRLKPEVLQNLLSELVLVQTNLEVLTILLENGADIQSTAEEIFQYACDDGDHDRIGFLLQNGCKLSQDVLNAGQELARQNGDVVLKKFLNSLHC
jgi:hypothetical protein